jgi:hypothetical protein
MRGVGTREATEAFPVRSFGTAEHAALPSLEVTLSVDEPYFDPLAAPE